MIKVNFDLPVIEAALEQIGLKYMPGDHRIFVPFTVNGNKLDVNIWAEDHNLVVVGYSKCLDTLGEEAANICQAWNNFTRWPTAKTQKGSSFLRHDHYIGEMVEVDYLAQVLKRLVDGAVYAQTWFVDMMVGPEEFEHMHSQIRAYLADHA